MRLHNYLEREGLSATDFARKVGVSQSTISRYLKGLRHPERDTMLAIRKATSGAVQPNDFFDTPATEDIAV